MNTLQDKEIINKVEELVLSILSNTQLILVNIEYVCEKKEWFLRVYIDKTGGVEIADCVLVSKQLSKLLDEQDFIKNKYYLEVSSPGK